MQAVMLNKPQLNFVIARPASLLAELYGAT